MYNRPTARPSATATRSSRLQANAPLLILCCVGTILFIITATIVLALIPIYLPRKDAALGGRTQTYSFTLTPSEKLGDDGVFGEDDKQRIANAISTALGLQPTALTFNGNIVVATVSGGRRKRRPDEFVRYRRQSNRRQKCYARGAFFRSLCRKEKCLSGSTTKTEITVLITYGTTQPRSVTFDVVITVDDIDIPPTQAPSTSAAGAGAGGATVVNAGNQTVSTTAHTTAAGAGGTTAAGAGGTTAPGAGGTTAHASQSTTPHATPSVVG